MIRAVAIAIAVLASGCAVLAGSYALPSAIYLVVPAGRVHGGEGGDSKQATARIAAAEEAARVTAANDAIAAARARPDDVRLVRRAAAMARDLAKQRSVLVGLDDVLVLLARHPCPGLADLGATHVALGDPNAAGDAYLRAARECASVEAAIAAVYPLREAERCDDAVAALREMWPRVDSSRRGAWLDVLDAVAACSDSITLRRNLSFVPASVFEDYLAVLDARAARHRESERRAAAEAAAEASERAAEDRARANSSHCESECSAARSSCTSSCGGDVSCMQRCDSIGHVCRSGCGAY